MAPATPLEVPEGEPLVLHVEDDPINRRLLRAIARRRDVGVHVVSAETGTEGIRLAQQRPPDLVLLDLDLPDMNGRAVLAGLRGDASTRQVRVVVVSANTNPATIAELLDAGADDYVTKPYDIHRIQTVLDRAGPTSPEEDH